MNREISNTVMLLRLAESKGDKEKAAEYRETLTDLYFKTGDKQSALASAFQLLELHKNGDKKKTASICLKLGQIFSESFYGASHYLNKAVKLFNELGDKANGAVAEYCLGMLYFSKDFDKDRYGKAFKHFEKSTDLFHEQKNPRGVSLSLIGQAKCLCKENDFQNAEKILEIAVDISRNIDTAGYLDEGLYYLSQIYHFEEKDFKAQKQIEEAIEITRQTGETETLPTKLKLYGEILLSLEKYEEATAAFKECEKIKRKQGDLDGLRDVIHLTGYTLYKKGEYENAVLYFQEELFLNDSETALPGIYRSLGLTYEKLGYMREALSCYEKQVKTMHTEITPDADVLEALYDLARAYSVSDSTLDRAEDTCTAILSLYGSLSDEEKDDCPDYNEMTEKLLSNIRPRLNKSAGKLQDSGLKEVFTQEYVRKAVLSLISDITGKKNITAETELQEDEAIHSIIAAEKEFDITFEDQDIENVKTAGDLIKTARKIIKDLKLFN